MNFISRKIINKYFLIPLYFRFFNNIKLNSLFYIIVIIIYLFRKTETLIWFSAENFQNWLLCHMCYCLMKNVLNSFEFTFATCKDMLMRMLLLIDINIYYLITKKEKKKKRKRKIYIYIYIFITLPRDKSNKLEGYLVHVLKNWNLLFENMCENMCGWKSI